MNIKIQCPCGTKFAFDVEPSGEEMPVAVACPDCGADATGQANEQIHRQKAESAAALPATPPPVALPGAGPSPTPSAPQISPPSVPLRPGTSSASITPPHPKRIHIQVGPASGEKPQKPELAARPAPVVPAGGATRLSVRAHAPAPPTPSAPPATPTEPAPASPATVSLPSPPPPTPTTEPAAPKPPEPAAPATPQCSRHPRQEATETCTVCGKPICPECMAQFGYLCSPYCQEQARRREIEVPEFAGQKSVQWQKEVRTGNRVLTALGLVAAVLLGSFVTYHFVLSRPKVAFSLTSPKSVPFIHAEMLGPDRLLTVTPQRASVRDWKLDREIWSAALAPAAASPAGGGLDASLDPNPLVRVRRVGSALWVGTATKVVQLDLANGTKRAEVPLPPHVSELSGNEFGFLAAVATNPYIHHFTRVDFQTATARSESIRLPVVRRRTIAATDEFNGDAPTPPPDVRNEVIPSGGGAISLVAQLVESRILQREAVRKPKQSILDKDGGPSAAQSLDAAMEFANENQAAITEDQSVYRVSLRRLFGSGPEWTGSVTGAPAIFPLPTLDLLVAGTTMVVFDKNNRKQWDARLNHGIGPRFGSGILDPDVESVPGAQPALQNNTRLYVFDQGTLTAFDIRDGRVAWRLPSVGITQVVPAGSYLYVASTTAGPESIQYSKDVALNEKISKVLHKVDAATGKVEWSRERIGDEPKVSGKFLYVALKKTFLMDTIGESDSRQHYFLRRINPSDGQPMWEYYQRGPADAFEPRENQLLLRFPEEVRLLKFMSL